MKRQVFSIETKLIFFLKKRQAQAAYGQICWREWLEKLDILICDVK